MASMNYGMAPNCNGNAPIYMQALAVIHPCFISLRRLIGMQLTLLSGGCATKVMVCPGLPRQRRCGGAQESFQHIRQCYCCICWRVVDK